MLDPRPIVAEVDLRNVVDEEGAMRVAHTGANRVALDGKRQCVDVLRQADVLPVELWMAHVDRCCPVSVAAPQ